MALSLVMFSGEQRIELTAMVFAGATFCLPERSFGDPLRLDAEFGIRQEFRTAAGDFLAYGHEVTLSTLGIEVDYEQVLYLVPYDSPPQ